MFQTIKGGCLTRHPHTFQMLRNHGVANYVLLIVHTASIFQINKIKYHLLPGAAVLIKPHTPYSYANPESEYMDDWIHFNTTSDISTQFSLPTNEPFPISNIDLYTTFIQQLLWELSYPTSASMQEENTQALFLVLMNHLSQDYANRTLIVKQTPYQSSLQFIHMDIHTTPGKEHHANVYAAKLAISVPYFQHLYRQLFHISFQQDVIHCRIHYAKDLLTSNNLSIAQIAELCGYQTEVHFHRQFKQHVGLTPAKYRNYIPMDI